MGLCLMDSLGEKAGVPTPICVALITIGSLLLKTDFRCEGRTLDTIGLGNMTKEQIAEYVVR